MASQFYQICLVSYEIVFNGMLSLPGLSGATQNRDCAGSSCRDRREVSCRGVVCSLLAYIVCGLLSLSLVLSCVGRASFLLLRRWFALLSCWPALGAWEIPRLTQ